MKLKTKNVGVTLDEKCIQLVDEAAKSKKSLIPDGENFYVLDSNTSKRNKYRCSVIAGCIEYCLMLDDKARAEMSPEMYIELRNAMVKALKHFDVNENNELVSK